MLAIVIPYYKATFFEKTLQSLVAQSDKNFRLYIGDDASPNSPHAILEKYREKIDFEYVRFKENFGSTDLTRQWTRCIAMASTADWIMILGDDDVLGENVVSSFYVNLPQLKSYNVVRFASCLIDENGKIISQIHQSPKLETSTDFIFRENRSSLSEYVFKKDRIEKIGFRNFPLAWFSDLLAVLEFSDFRNVFSINEAMVKVRISKESISGMQNNYKPKSRASFEFYHYLLTKKKRHFTNPQWEKLLELLTMYYLNDKKSVSRFYKLTTLYFTNFKWKGYFDFLRHFVLKLKKT